MLLECKLNIHTISRVVKSLELPHFVFNDVLKVCESEVKTMRERKYKRLREDERLSLRFHSCITLPRRIL